MFISDAAIRKPVITVVTMLALVGFGAYALLNLETDEFPEIQAPIVAVSIPYPGAAPETVARELLEPIEEALQSLSGVDEIQSTAMDGFAQIITTFDFSTPVEQASQDVRDAISGIRGDLPTQMEEPIIRRFDPADLPIVSLVLTSEKLSAAELTRIADPRITRALRSINGVAQVNLVGGVERELTVELKPDALRAANVSVSQVVEALQTQNLAAPVGSLVGPTEERSIRLQGRLQTPAEFRQIVVAQRGGQVIRLEQVASVVDASEEPRSAALFNGGRAIGLDVLKSRGTSTTRVAEDVVDAARELTPSLPGGVSLRVVRNAGERVAESVTNVQHALVEGAALTVLVVFLFLNSWRSTVITGLALPVSVVASFIAVLAFGFTLNTMSLLGLSLAIGILIDDAIVVRENIVRHVQMGKDHLRASFEATDEIGMAVAATTFSIVAVFVPIAFMEGIAGQWFKPFALTIACSVLVSLFVSFSLDPMLSAYWPDPHREGEARGRLTRLLDRFNAWFDRQADRYRVVIGWALDHRWTMVGLAAASLVGAVALQVMFGGFGFAPDSDRSELTLQLEAPPGASIDYTRIKANEVGEIIRRHDAVAYTYTTVGGGGGDFGSTGSVDTASIYVRMKPRSERSVSQQDFGRELRQELQSVNNATVALFTSGFGGAQRQLQMRVLGPDPDQLARIATQVADQIRQVPNTVDVELSTRGEKPELEVEVDRALASTLGVSVADVGQALRIAFAGVDAGDWVDPSGETRDVMVRLAPEARTRAADLEQLPLVISNAPVGTSGDAGAGQRAATPDVLPLRQVASITAGLGPAQIQHLDGDPVITVGANIEGRSLGEVTGDVQQRLAALALPAGYRIEPGGESQDQQEVFVDVFGALGLAVMLMYLILVAQFGSFVDPLAILISLPLSLIGVVLALLVTRDTLNIMSLIGVILLMGVVAKNAILLIDFAKWTRETGVDRRTAIIEAGRTRLRPIFMTTFALIAGMTPVALGSGEGADFRAPLGRAVIGGVITSTLLTLLVIPTIYEILDEARAWVAARASRLLHHEPASHQV
jgi:HAE1 family hydrophobic/amphiphilic exporter-1